MRKITDQFLNAGTGRKRAGRQYNGISCVFTYQLQRQRGEVVELNRHTDMGGTPERFVALESNRRLCQSLLIRERPGYGDESERSCRVGGSRCDNMTSRKVGSRRGGGLVPHPTSYSGRATKIFKDNLYVFKSRQDPARNGCKLTSLFLQTRAID